MSKVSEYKIKFRFGEGVYYFKLTLTKRFVERDKPSYKKIKDKICSKHRLPKADCAVLSVMKGRDFT